MRGIGTRGQSIHGVSMEGWVSGGSEAAARTFKSVRLPTASSASRQLRRGRVWQGAASICPPVLQPVGSAARCSSVVQTDGRPHHECNRIGFCLAHGLGGGNAPLGTMQESVCEFMN